MRHCRLTGSVLMLGMCLLLGSARLYGQRPVIAATAAATPQTPTVPSAPAPIQPVSYVPDSPNNPPVVQPPAPAPMLPPNALISGMTNNAGAMNTANPAETNGGMPVPPAGLSVEVVGSDHLLLGQPLAYEIVVRNREAQPIAELHVEEPLPPDVRVLKTDPPALKRNERLAWDFRYLEPGGERRLKVELAPGRPGELDLRPYVTFLGGSGLRTQVIRPPFSIEISADNTKPTRGQHIRFHIQLANHGDAPVRNIKIYDALPSGLYHPMGRKIGVEHFGDLLPGETRSIDLETTAVESGKFRNEIIAQADRGVEAQAALEVVVTEPRLALRIDGPDRTATQREADFYLEVSNPSVLTAKNVQLMQALPPVFEVVSASKGASHDSNQHTLVWLLPELGAGQRQRVMFRIKADTAGDWPMSAAVLSGNFPEARIRHTLHTEAAAILKLEVHAREERLSIGAETVFRMHVFNKGDAPCTGVRLTATLPETVMPIKAEGPSREQIEKQQVRFDPFQLDACGDVVYCVHVRGRQAGKGPFRVELTAEKQTPAVREISIQVHAAGEGDNKQVRIW